MSRDIIKESDLKRMVEDLNNTKQSIYPYSLDFAYGGVKLVQDCKGGGCRAISCNGYGTKRELYNFIKGMQAGREY